MIANQARHLKVLGFTEFLNDCDELGALDQRSQLDVVFAALLELGLRVDHSIFQVGVPLLGNMLHCNVESSQSLQGGTILIHFAVE